VREDAALPSVVLVTGTGTEVGKTVTTATLATILVGRGLRVAVVKPAQTGVAPDDPGDADEVRRIVGDTDALEVHELARAREALAPDTAARRAGIDLPTVASVARHVAELARRVDVVLVEGSGGLLVRLDGRGGTLADLGRALRYSGVGTGVVLVVAAGLGTLNHTALTAEALRARDLPLLGLVVGSWPRDPGLAERCNLEDLPDVAGAPLMGVIPEGVGGLDPSEVQSAAAGWFRDPDVAGSAS
jgi:dethiobiotin synthetase